MSTEPVTAREAVASIFLAEPSLGDKTPFEIAEVVLAGLHVRGWSVLWRCASCGSTDNNGMSCFGCGRSDADET